MKQHEEKYWNRIRHFTDADKQNEIDRLLKVVNSHEVDDKRTIDAKEKLHQFERKVNIEYGEDSSSFAPSFYGPVYSELEMPSQVETEEETPEHDGEIGPYRTIR